MPPSLIPPWEDQCEWHKITRVTGLDCAVMCYLINKHTHTHTHTFSVINDITVILPPELSLDMAAIGKVTEWLQEGPGVEGISLDLRKSQVLLADRVGPEHLTEEVRTVMDNTDLTVVRQGMGVVRVSVGT